jgi:hypothetical protein
MSTLLFWGIIVCMVSNKTNLNLLYLGQINNIYMVEPTRLVFDAIPLDKKYTMNCGGNH